MIDPYATVTIAEAVTALPVSAATIRTWAHRGFKDLDGKRRKIKAVDHEGPRGAARYRWCDLADAERATRRNPKSPGRSQALVAAAA